jgi:hypothetical protein
MRSRLSAKERVVSIEEFKSAKIAMIGNSVRGTTYVLN